MMLLVAIALLIGGLVIMYLSPGAKNATLVTVVWWLGLLVCVLGALLILTPVMVFVTGHLETALGMHR